MKKSKNSKSYASHKRKASDNGAGASASTTRRGFLSKIRNGAIGTVAVGGFGAYMYSAYSKDVAERDLTKIGKGKPAIVQIHDPSCGLCTALQRETRSALSNIEQEEYEFLVANITTEKGRIFANNYNVAHVTLLLFDGRGKLQQVLQGVKQEEELLPIFTDLVSKGS